MRGVLSFYLIAATGIFGLAAGTGLTGSLIAAIPIAFAFAFIAGYVLSKFSILSIAENSSSKGLKIVFLVTTISGLIQLARLLVFMIAPSQVAFSTFPSSNWEVKHSCFSAYYVAAKSAGNVPDIYANSLYSMPDDNPALPRKAKTIGSFNLDVYEYPPPFLLVQEIVNHVTPDFLRARMLWFAINGLIVISAMILIAKAMGPVAGNRAILFAPLVWVSMPFLGTLQKGNVQMLIIAISMIAMLLFSKKHFSSGGVLLAFATASKLYPGMLIVYLILRRQWRAVIYTATMGIAIALLALAIEGWQSYSAFLTHLPGLLSGEAFPAFRRPNAVAVNYSIPGIIFKLKLFGMNGMDFGASKIVGWIYTLILLAIIVLISKRINQKNEDGPMIWLSILILATLRSPFLPQAYAGFPPLWLLTLVAAVYPSPKTLVITILAWLGLNLMIPTDWNFTPQQLALITTIPQALTIGLGFFALRRFELSPSVSYAPATAI